VSDAVLQKIGTVGQISVQTMGDIDVDVSRLAIGTGAITRCRRCTNWARTFFWRRTTGHTRRTAASVSFDIGIPVIIVCHSTSELPGMMALANYVPTVFPGIPVHYLPRGLPPTRTLV